MKKRRLKILATSGIIILLAVTLFFLLRPEKMAAVRVVRGEISSGVEEDGYLQPLEDRNFYATQTARITELPVEAGDEVSQGQLLIGMTNPDLEAILAETRAYWRQAEKSEIGYAAAAASLRLLLADENRKMER